MRYFEVLLTGLLATGAMWSLAGGNRGRMVLPVLFVLDVVAFCMHLSAEGAHWQLTPAYLGLLLFAGLLIRNPGSNVFAKYGPGMMIFLALLSVCLSAIVPMFRLPRPTGIFAVGTRVIYLVDRDRSEDRCKGKKREIMIQVWYPAEPSSLPYAPYRRREETTLLSSYQNVLPTNSKWNAPVLKTGDPFPVLLFNPAWNGRRTQNTYLVEDLASHGFVVVGIDHTYNSSPVAFPDGRVVRAVSVKEMDFNTSSLETLKGAAEKELLQQTKDDIFVLNQLERMNGDEASEFHGRLNTQDAGALGHSFGGAVSAQACYEDPRIRGALNLDGSLFGEVQRQGLAKPFMFMTEDVSIFSPEQISRFPHGQQIDNALNQGDAAMFAKSNGYRVILHGSSHFSFTDKSLFSPIKPFSSGGAIAPQRQILIIRAYALAFFEKVLLGRPSPLLDSGTSPYPEVDFHGKAPKAAKTTRVL